MTRMEEVARLRQGGGRVTLLPGIEGHTTFIAWVLLHETREIALGGGMDNCALARFLRDAGAPRPRIIGDAYSDDIRLPGLAPLPDWALVWQETTEMLHEDLGIQSLTGNEVNAIMARALVRYTPGPVIKRHVCRDTRVPDFLADAPLQQRPGYVYLLESEGGLYKIGRSVDPDSRTAAIASMSPGAVKLVHRIRTSDQVELESRLHRHFQAKRARGEWFELSPADVGLIRSLYCWPAEGWQ